MRYLICLVDDPVTGHERLGTEAQQFMTYASVSNLIRFGLRKPGILPGQYNVYIWPEGGQISSKPVAVVYKRV